MFVSSYSTYIATNAAQQLQKERIQSLKESSSTFKNSLNSQAQTENKTLFSQKSQLPLNYISEYKVINNQQKLQQDTQEKSTQTDRYTKILNQTSAEVAYTENSSLFSLHRKPKVTLDQTQTINTTLPLKAQEAQERLHKSVMVNTYIANDNYYRITA